MGVLKGESNVCRFTLKSNPHKFAEILGVTFGLGEWLRNI